MTVVATLLGSLLAIVGAWRGGWVDGLVARLLDVLFSFPGLLLAILAAAVFGTGLTAPVIALCISYVPYVARIVRSAAVRERALPYVSALELQGLSGLAICARHLVPNVATTIGAQAAITFGYAMVDLAAINFLGLGLESTSSDWGVMVAAGQSLDPARPAGGGAVRRRRDRDRRRHRQPARATVGARRRPGVAAMSLLSLRELTITLPTPAGPRPVVRDVSFELAAHEALALVGESGSGKSMTVRSLLRLLPQGAQVSGEIRFDGADVMAMSGRELRALRGGRVGMVFQDPRAAVNPVRTIGDFLTERLGRGAAARASRAGAAGGGARRAGRRRGGCGSTRTSCRAACCSGR